MSHAEDFPKLQAAIEKARPKLVPRLEEIRRTGARVDSRRAQEILEQIRAEQESRATSPSRPR